MAASRSVTGGRPAASARANPTASPMVLFIFQLPMISGLRTISPAKKWLRA